MPGDSEDMGLYRRRCRRCGVTFSALSPRARFCSTAHRVAYHRAAWETGAGALHDRYKNDRSGLQVSYRKAVEEAALLLIGPRIEDPELARLEAERCMAMALSPAQRARLEARS